MWPRGPPRAPTWKGGRDRLGEAAYGEPRQAEVGAGEQAQVDGVPVQPNVLQVPAGVSVLHRVAEGVCPHGLYHVILERTCVHASLLDTLAPGSTEGATSHSHQPCLPWALGETEAPEPRPHNKGRRGYQAGREVGEVQRGEG